MNSDTPSWRTGTTSASARNRWISRSLATGTSLTSRHGYIKCINICNIVNIDSISKTHPYHPKKMFLFEKLRIKRKGKGKGRKTFYSLFLLHKKRVCQTKRTRRREIIWGWLFFFKKRKDMIFVRIYPLLWGLLREQGEVRGRRDNDCQRGAHQTMDFYRNKGTMRYSYWVRQK